MVYSSYAAHLDMISHTSIFMSIVKGGTCTLSCKEQLYSKSSTETKLVVIDDAMEQILWTRHILAEQGIHVHTTTIYRIIRELS